MKTLKFFAVAVFIGLSAFTATAQAIQNST